MKIFFQVGSHGESDTDTLEHYFSFNQLPFHRFDLFEKTINNFDLLSKSPSLLIISFYELYWLLTDTNTSNKFLEFAKQDQNRIWVWSDVDGITGFIKDDFLIPKKLDNELTSKNVTCFLNGKLNSKYDQLGIKNIKLEIIPYPWMIFSPRIKNAIVEKQNCEKDFLATIVIKESRSHRDILLAEMKRRPELISKGISHFRNIDDPYIGECPTEHTWRDGFPSMDLYSNAWIELVSETLSGPECCFITEKTVKPIATRTPFLIQSTTGHLEYLRSFGFKTFNDLIDESYDSEPDVYRRTRMIVDQLEYIVNTGAEKFYKASKDILDHNHYRLLEITGIKQYYVDLFIKKNLDKLNIE